VNPSYREVLITPQKEGKGRSFGAVLLASVEADLLWAGGQSVSENIRPVWAMFAGSDQSLRAFMANLTTGHKAKCVASSYRSRNADQIELLRSAGYQVAWQREAEGSIATVFLPELFQLDPGMVDPEGVRFVLLPTQEWYEAQTVADTHSMVRHVRRVGYDLPVAQVATWVPLSFLFAAYLDRRTRCPLIADGRFYLQLMVACLQQGLASFSTVPDRVYHDAGFGHHPKNLFHEVGTLDVGLHPGLAFNSDHLTLEALLAREVERYFSVA